MLESPVNKIKEGRLTSPKPDFFEIMRKKKANQDLSKTLTPLKKRVGLSTLLSPKLNFK